jgi:hypothetical protein
MVRTAGRCAQARVAAKIAAREIDPANVFFGIDNSPKKKDAPV